MNDATDGLHLFASPLKVFEMELQDRDVISWDGHEYAIRIYPANTYYRTKNGRVLIEVELREDGPLPPRERKLADDDQDSIHDAVWQLIGEIESIMRSTWEAEDQAWMDEERAVQMRRY